MCTTDKIGCLGYASYNSLQIKYQATYVNENINTYAAKIGRQI